MSKVDISTVHTHTTTHRATISGDEVRRVLAEHVAAASGLTVDGCHIRAVCHVNSQMGNYGTELSAEVTIIVDHCTVAVVAAKSA